MIFNFTLHGVIDFQVIPSAFVLLPAKDGDTYKKMIRMLKEGALTLGLELKPMKLIIDFEKAAINAFKFHFPLIVISCCFSILVKAYTGI